MEEEDEGRQSLPLNIDMVGQVTVFQEETNRSLDELLETVEVIVGDEFATPVSILNGPFQAALLSLLVMLSIGANACVINNIRHNCIKLRSTHFILIQHLCMADLIGASLILPAPLVTSFRGRWEGGSNLCHLSSVVNVSLWLQHVFMFLMLKVRIVRGSYSTYVYWLRLTDRLCLLLLSTTLFLSAFAPLLQNFFFFFFFESFPSSRLYSSLFCLGPWFSSTLIRQCWQELGDKKRPKKEKENIIDQQGKKKLCSAAAYGQSVWSHRFPVAAGLIAKEEFPFNRITCRGITLGKRSKPIGYKRSRVRFNPTLYTSSLNLI